MIEITMFHLVDGADVEAFLEADKEAQTAFFYAQPGIVRRTTARGEDGEWLEVTLWWSAEVADAAARDRATNPAALALDALVDPRSVSRRRYTELDG